MTDTPDRTADGTPDRPAATAALRVLVVDDDADAAESLAMLLTLDGHAVRVCTSGRQAVVDAAAFAPAVVLLDLGLPDLPGDEVAALLRATPGGAKLLLVAVTGQQPRHARSRQAGFDHHLTKPVHPDMLNTLLDTAR